MSVWANGERKLNNQYLKEIKIFLIISTYLIFLFVHEKKTGLIDKNVRF